MDKIKLKNISTPFEILSTLNSINQNLNRTITNVTIDDSTGVFTFVYADGTKFDVDTLLEKVVTNFDLDTENNDLVLTLNDGVEKRVNLSKIINNLILNDYVLSVQPQTWTETEKATARKNIGVPSISSTNVQLLANDWEDNIQSKIIVGAAEATKIQISIKDRMQSIAYGQAQIFVTQDGNKLIFTATSAPTKDIEVNINMEVWPNE